MNESLTSPLAYYATQGPITDPGDHAGLFDDLPDSIPALCQVVQGLMIHRAFADFYGLQVSDDRREEADLRHVSALLSRILELDSRPLTCARPPEGRLLIVCRDFATLLCAMLRHQGVPARARCGFARYFGQCPNATPGFNVDHWVCEVWDAAARRWVLVDAEVDENERGFCHIEIDTLDVPRDQFLVAGAAWQLCRSGEADPHDFGLAPEPDAMHGLWYITNNTPGAVDNASGVAILLALAESLSKRELPVGLEWIVVNGEENGGLGDAAYLRQREQMLGQILALINLDGVGQRVGANTITAMGTSQPLQNLVRHVHRRYPSVIWADPWYESDHSAFLWRGVPCIPFSSIGVANTAHLPADTVEWISPARLGEVASLVTEVIESLQDQSPDCPILLCCVDERGLEHCAQCEEFICEKLEPFAHDDNPKYREALERLRQIAESRQ